MDEGFSIFENNILGVRMLIPRNWQAGQVKSQEGVGAQIMFFVKDNAWIGGYISVMKPCQMTFDEFINLRLNSSAMPITKLSDSTRITIDNNPGQVIQYIDKEGYPKLDLLTVNNGKGYLMTLTVTTSIQETVDKIIKSFKAI